MSIPNCFLFFESLTHSGTQEFVHRCYFKLLFFIPFSLLNSSFIWSKESDLFLESNPALFCLISNSSVVHELLFLLESVVRSHIEYIFLCREFSLRFLALFSFLFHFNVYNWSFLCSRYDVSDLFSCPGQLNRWPCHSLTHSLSEWVRFWFSWQVYFSPWQQ